MLKMKLLIATSLLVLPLAASAQLLTKQQMDYMLNYSHQYNTCMVCHDGQVNGWFTPPKPIQGYEIFRSAMDNTTPQPPAAAPVPPAPQPAPGPQTQIPPGYRVVPMGPYCGCWGGWGTPQGPQN